MRRALLRYLKSKPRGRDPIRIPTVLAVFALLVSFAGPVWAVARGGEPAPVGEKIMQATGFMVSGVGFDGEFYPPVGSPRKLGVLVLGGSDGGVPSRRAKLIAEKGFPVLALAYFKTKRTPQYLDMIPLEYFDEPVDWLKQNQHTRGADCRHRGVQGRRACPVAGFEKAGDLGRCRLCTQCSRIPGDAKGLPVSPIQLVAQG